VPRKRLFSRQMKRVLLGAPIAHAFHEKIKISLCIFFKKIVHQVIEVDLLDEDFILF